MAGKNPLATIAMIAVVIVAAVATAYVGGAGGWAIAAGYSATEAAAMGAVAGMAIAVAGSLLVNALLPPSVADVTGGTADFAKSSTYGWEVSGNADRENVPWPVLYGTHRVCPPIIAKYVEVVGDKQYLNLLYGVADHAIDSIDEDSVEINDNPVVRGEDGIDWEIRLGGLDPARSAKLQRHTGGQNHRQQADDVLDHGPDRRNHGRGPRGGVLAPAWGSATEPMTAA